MGSHAAHSNTAKQQYGGTIVLWVFYILQAACWAFLFRVLSAEYWILNNEHQALNDRVWLTIRRVRHVHVHVHIHAHVHVNVQIQCVQCVAQCIQCIQCVRLQRREFSIRIYGKYMRDKQLGDSASRTTEQPNWRTDELTNWQTNVKWYCLQWRWTEYCVCAAIEW